MKTLIGKTTRVLNSMTSGNVDEGDLATLLNNICSPRGIEPAEADLRAAKNLLSDRHRQKIWELYTMCHRIKAKFRRSKLQIVDIQGSRLPGHPDIPFQGVLQGGLGAVNPHGEHPPVAERQFRGRRADCLGIQEFPRQGGLGNAQPPAGN